MMQAEYGHSRSGAGKRGENRCVPPAAETHVEDGSEKYRPEARRGSETAVMAAIFSTGTCAVAMSWGMRKKMIPLLNPSVVLERPISHTGGTRRVEFKRTSGECTSCYYRSRRLACAAIAPNPLLRTDAES
jgi:hypothetical protein